MAAAILGLGLIAIAASPAAERLAPVLAPQSAQAFCSPTSTNDPLWVVSPRAAFGSASIYSTGSGSEAVALVSDTRGWAAACSQFRYSGWAYNHNTGASKSLYLYWGLLSNAVVGDAGSWMPMNNGAGAGGTSAANSLTLSSGLPDHIYIPDVTFAYGYNDGPGQASYALYFSDCSTNYGARATNAGNAARQTVSPYINVAADNTASGNPGANCGTKTLFGPGGSATTLYIDSVAPTAQVTPNFGPNGSNGWYVSVPTWTTSGLDVGYSGIASCTGAQAPAGDTASGSVSGNCTSKAGLTGGYATATYKLDQTNPSPSASVPTYSTTRAISVGFTASDATSGIWYTNLYYDDGGWQYCGSQSTATSGSLGCTLPRDGTFTMIVYSVDISGRATAATASVVIDTQSPPTTISTTTSCVSPGGLASITVGRTDPAPTSGWPTFANASTSWWSGTEDPWTGAWRNDPWPGNTNASATYSVGYPTPASGTQATYTRVVWTRDNAGNTTDGVPGGSQGRNGVSVTVDNNTPTSPSLNAPASTKTATVNLTFSAVAGGCKGIDQVAISNDGVNWDFLSGYSTSFANWDITNATYGGNSSQGTHTIYIAFREAGSQAADVYGRTSRTITYDTAAPTISWTTPATAGYNTSGTITPAWTVADTGGSGVASAGVVTRFYQPTLSNNVCSGAAVNDGAQASGTVTALTSGRCYYWTFTTAPADLAGNTTSTNLTSAIVKVDANLPDGGGGLATIYTKVAGVTIDTSSASDSGGSGLFQMRFSNNGGTNWSAYQAYATSASWTLTSGDGPKPVSVQYKDNAGNESAPNVLDYFLDTVNPSGSIVINAGDSATNNTTVTLTISATDPGGANASGVLQMQFSNDGAIWASAVPYATSASYTLPSGDGTKTVYARFIDAAGNISVSTNDSIIFEGTPPTGSVVINAGQTATNSLSATLTLATSSASGPSQMRFSNDGSSFGSYVAFASSYAYSLPAGDGTKTVYVQFLDAAGNVSTPAGSISDSITLDTTAPGGTVSINGGASTTTSASVTLTLSASDPSSGTGVTQMQFSNDGSTWSSPQAYGTSASWTLSGGDGIKTVSARFIDAAGNVSSTVSATIRLDTTAPSGSFVINAGSTSTSSTAVTLTLSASDGGSGLSAVRFSNDGTTYGSYVSYSSSASWTLTSGDGSKTVYAQFKDTAGNVSSAVTSTILLDTGGPTGSISVNAGAAATGSTGVSLTLSASDSGSGVSQMRFSDDGATWSSYQAYATSKAWTLPAGDGNKTVHVQFLDAAGNASADITDSILLDTTAPAGSIVINGGAASTNTAAVSITLSASDAGSGLADYRLSLDGGTTFGAWLSYTTSVSANLPAGDGSKTLAVQFRDAVGNASASFTATILLDTIAPSGSFVINAGSSATNSTTVTLTLSANDPAPASGLTSMRFSNDGSTWSSYQAYATSATWTLSSGDGSKTVHAQFRDAAGNVSSEATSSILLDTAGASGTISIDGGAAATNNTTAALAISASAASGISQMRFSADGTTWGSYQAYSTSASFTLTGADGSKAVYVEFLDGAGNVSSPVSDSILLDTAAPAGSVVINSGATYTTSTSVSLSLSASDPAPASGVTDYRISSDGGSTFGAWTSYATSVSATLGGADGAKTLTVEFRDDAGNVSADASDGITLDRVAPSGSFVINAGDTATNSTNVSLTLSASDATSGLTSMRFSNDGSSWSSYQAYATSASWTLSSGDGTKTVYAEFKDAAGNVSAPATSTILLDTAGPSGAIVIDAGSSYASSTSVTLTLSASSPSGVSQMRFSNDGSTWGGYVAYASSFSYTLPGGDGTQTVHVEFRDGAGNVSPDTTDSIVLDTTAPSGSIVINGGAAATNSTSVTVSFVITDSGSGLALYRLSADGSTWGSWTAYASSAGFTLAGADGSKTVHAQFADNAGNVSGDKTDAILLDTVAPAGSLVINAGDSATNSTSVTLTLSASDTAPASGLTSMRFSDDGSNWGSYVPYATSHGYSLPAGDGDKTVYVEFKDAAGNVSAPGSDTIQLATDLPSGSIVINAGSNETASTSVTLTLSASASAGVTQMRFSDDGSTWGGYVAFASSQGYSLPAGDGSKTVYVEFLDGAGNVSDPATATILLDTTAPSGTLSINSGASNTASTSVSLTLSASDASGSGVTQMRFSDDGATWSSYQAYGTTKAWTVPAGDGSKTVYVEFKDAAGNVSADASDSITLDSSVPSGSVTIDAGATATNSSAVTLTIAAAGGTITDMRFSNDGTTFGAWLAYANAYSYSLTAGDGTRTVYVEFRNSLGTVSASPASDSILVDTTAPTVDPTVDGTAVNGSPGHYSSAVSITLTGADSAGSGVSVITYFLDGDATTIYSDPIAVSSVGDHTLTYWATDNAGNTMVAATLSFTIEDAGVPSDTSNFGAWVYDCAAGSSSAVFDADGTINATVGEHLCIVAVVTEPGFSGNGYTLGANPNQGANAEVWWSSVGSGAYTNPAKDSVPFNFTFWSATGGSDADALPWFVIPVTVNGSPVNYTINLHVIVSSPAGHDLTTSQYGPR